MIVLLVLFGSLFFFRALGMAGVAAFQSWILSARVALAVMFLFTATSHFTPLKKDLIAMVPPGLPRPDLLVLLTGMVELASAIGLLIPATRYWAAWGLIVLMAAMLPANISAARRGADFHDQVDASPPGEFPRDCCAVGPQHLCRSAFRCRSCSLAGLG